MGCVYLLLIIYIRRKYTVYIYEGMYTLYIYLFICTCDINDEKATHM